METNVEIFEANSASKLKELIKKWMRMKGGGITITSVVQSESIVEDVHVVGYHHNVTLTIFYRELSDPTAT